MKLLKELLMENKFHYRDEDAEEAFNSGDNIIDDITLGRGDEEKEPEDFGLTHIGDVISPEGTYRPGAVEQELYLDKKGRVVAREVLTGDNSHVFMITKFKKTDLSKFFS